MTKYEAIQELKAFKNKSWDGMPEEVIDIQPKGGQNNETSDS